MTWSLMSLAGWSNWQYITLFNQKSYLTKKLANNEKSNEELKTIMAELDRWGKDLKKRANYYDL